MTLYRKTKRAYNLINSGASIREQSMLSMLKLINITWKMQTMMTTEIGAVIHIKRRSDYAKNIQCTYTYISEYMLFCMIRYAYNLINSGASIRENTM